MKEELNKDNAEFPMILKVLVFVGVVFGAVAVMPMLLRWASGALSGLVDTLAQFPEALQAM